VRVGILGAGAIALAHAALAASRGHEVALWSPSGQSLPPAGVFSLTATGALEGSYGVQSASLADTVVGAQAIIISLPAYGHAHVMQAAAPYIAAGQPVFVMPSLSLGGLLLAKLLHARGVSAPVVSVGTTVATARRLDATPRATVAAAPHDAKSTAQPSAAVRLLSVRTRLDIAATPASATGEMIALASNLFGDCFVPQSDALAIALSNVNPISHVPLALANLSRIEAAEAWTQYDRMTGSTARMIEALDAERLALARSLGLTVRSIHEHFHYSFGVPMASLDAQSRAVHASRGGVAGPTSLTTRYLTEDVPYGLAFISRLGRSNGVAVPVAEGCVALASAALGRDLAAENTLLALAGLDGMPAEALLGVARDGFA
jgi:opine dehydrogenase